jgi:hypothetical protein
VRSHLPEYARPIVTFAFVTGWRLRARSCPFSGDR